MIIYTILKANLTSYLKKKKIKLALQGGGSHGAFTWGVLDRLLKEDSIIIEAISGTSAGAVNAICLVDGYEENGREGARKKLRNFWYKVSRAGFFSPIRTSYLDKLSGNWNLDYSPFYIFFENIKSIMAPSIMNPNEFNPLSNILHDTIDFDRVNKCENIKLFVTATNVKKSAPHIFYQPHISHKVILASSLLPTLNKAVEIDGQYYWDGGFTANPSLLPLIEESDGVDDIVIVNLNNIITEKVPILSNEIANRINEITFNSALVKELRIIFMLQNYIKLGKFSSDKDRRILIHSIRCLDDQTLNSKSSKFNVEIDFLLYLKDLGHEYAENWIKNFWDKVGEENTFNFTDLLDIKCTKG